MDGRFGGCAYLSAAADAERYWYAMEDVDVALERLERSMVYDAETEPPRSWYGTYGEGVVVEYASESVRTCAASHQQSCPYPHRLSPVPGSFFVDVVSECIVPGDEVQSEPYFGLSYVCGWYKGLELDTKNEP